MHQKKQPGHDHVVAVGELEGRTIQVIVPPTAPDKFMWRVIANQGKKVDMSSARYDSLEDAFEAAVKFIVPDAIPVAFVTPSPEDFQVLNAMLFGLQDGATLDTFQEAFDMYQMLVRAWTAISQALEKMPGDYDRLLDVIGDSFGPSSWEAVTLKQLREIGIKSLQSELELCGRDLETLRGFLQAFTSL